MDKLTAIDPDALSPREALTLLYRLREDVQQIRNRSAENAA
ncbi:hypothetical protein [Acidocella sp. MX-AZ03]